MDRKVRHEARRLVHEARACLSGKREGIPKRVRVDMLHHTEALEEACREGDGEAMRTHLLPLDALVEEHMERKSTVREYAESIGIAILIALVLRAFVVEAFKIPSGSMIPTMEIGDHIFVNKFLYGVRIPYTRTKFFEYRAPRRGEVIVFIYPCEPEKDFIKRIVAVGGDTVEMRCNALYVNGDKVAHELLAERDECQYWDYENNIWSQERCSRYVEDLFGTRFETFYGPYRPDHERSLRADPSKTYQAGAPDRDFPDVRFGAPEMPRCDSQPAPGTLVGSFEDSHPERETYKDEGICAPKKRYRVPEGYVFVMGDNRDDSSDSRIWGPVPVENIKGKALVIWWSHKPGSNLVDGVSWERIGKVVY
jgi:signal peptidase I